MNGQHAGLGISIPFRITDRRVATSAGGEKIEESLIHILFTRVGERPMRRDFGGGLHDLVHDPDDDVLRALLRHRLAVAVERWEPRVELSAIEIDRRDDVLLVSLRYVLRGSEEPQSLSVPVPLVSR